MKYNTHLENIMLSIEIGLIVYNLASIFKEPNLINTLSLIIILFALSINMKHRFDNLKNIKITITTDE